ncbi:MAG: ornithine cyclodeaminase family protein [Proteobacteria bacterium]|nr:ornithine cyclodeaminase family protein [Pseudomonadota bacterium]
MTLLLTNEDAEAILTMNECIDALEGAYRDIARGIATPGQRSVMVSETGQGDGIYALKMLGGVVPSLGVGAIRINSDILTWPEEGGAKRRVKLPKAPGGRWVGLVLLFDIATGEPLAIFPDGVVQRMRVAGTSALGVKYMAREDATTAAIIGSGWQAGSQVTALCAVRDIALIRCFSPNAARRAAFCQEMAAKTGVEMIPAPSAEAAASGADIVLCATNSVGNVLFNDWIGPGAHITTIRDPEIEPAAIAAADIVVIHHPAYLSSDNIDAPRGLVIPDQSTETASRDELKDLSGAPVLADVIIGKAAGRNSDADLTCFLNYHGLGFQFAAVGGAFYRKARAQGRGRELPTEWFTEDVHP